MKKFSEFSNEIRLVSEGLSSVLYHFTNIQALEKILLSNTFELTSSIGTDSDHDLNPAGRFFFMSTARSRLGRYGSESGMGVYIELDGAKLAHNLKGGAVDYWGRSFRISAPNSSEMEDRIWSKDSEIKDFTKYIKSISILVTPEPDSEKDRNSWLEWQKKLDVVIRVGRIAEQKNIPVTVYDDRKHFLTNNKNKKMEVYGIGHGLGYSEARIKAFAELLELGRVPEHKIEGIRSGFSKEQLKYLDDMRYESTASHITQIGNDIHNNRKPNSSGKSLVDRITKTMQRLSIKTIGDAVELVKTQWVKRD